MVDTTLMYLVKQLELVVRTRLDALVSTARLTVPAYTAMTVLERSPGLTSADLARNSFVRPQTMAETIADLELRGLVSRTPDQQNLRRFRARLTAAGQDVLTGLRPAVTQIEQEMAQGLDAAELALFRETLRSCRETLAGTKAH